ncbi:MAG TPA: helix-turn-helix transcriptional regulator [Verrucomicrobiae bacterium]
MTTTAPNIRFREARERLGLSAEEVAASCGVGPVKIREIEDLEDDLTWCHSPKMVQKFCRVLGIRPIELFATDFRDPPQFPLVSWLNGFNKNAVREELRLSSLRISMNGGS